MLWGFETKPTYNKTAGIQSVSHKVTTEEGSSQLLKQLEQKPLWEHGITGLLVNYNEEPFNCTWTADSSLW